MEVTLGGGPPGERRWRRDGLATDFARPAPAADEPPADEFTQRKAEADAAASDEADALLASVKAMTNKD